MAFRKKSSTEQDVFCLPLPLRCEPWQKDRLNDLFQQHNNVMNALIGKKSRQLKQLERTKAWRQNEQAIADLRVVCKREKRRFNAEEKQIITQCFALRKQLISDFGLSADTFEKDIKSIAKHYENVMSPVAQKLAARVAKMFQDYFYGKGKKISFNPIDDLRDIEGKSNDCAICYSNGMVLIGRKANPLVIPVVFDQKDKYRYEEQALQRTVHYCKIIRTPGRHGWRYCVQLTLGGKPPVKVHADTGEMLHPLGHGAVGNDIGPQTLASVSDGHVKLTVLAESIDDIHKKLRRVNRAIDRSRRATNPQMFDEEGKIVPIDRLPDQYKLGGRRLWKKSKRYQELLQYRRYLYHQQTIKKLLSHRTLANKLLSYGDRHYIEQMNWQALARRVKEDRTTDTGKHKSKARFGKSIANRSPATFVKIYEKKVKDAGGTFSYLDTQKAKASQYNHTDHTYKPKKLSQRWNDINGEKVQRDLYSAFLIQHTNETLDGFEQEGLEQDFNTFLILHNQEINRLSITKNPSSMGIKA